MLRKNLDSDDSIFSRLVILIAVIMLAIVISVPDNKSSIPDHDSIKTDSTVKMEYRKDIKGICYAYSTITTDRFTSVPCDKAGL